MIKAYKFTNFSGKDFAWKWNGGDWLFKAGEGRIMEEYLARHFAKHLVDREMTTMKKKTNTEPLRTELLDKCLHETGIEAESSEELASKILSSGPSEKAAPAAEPATEEPKQETKAPIANEADDGAAGFEGAKKEPEDDGPAKEEPKAEPKKDDSDKEQEGEQPKNANETTGSQET